LSVSDAVSRFTRPTASTLLATAVSSTQIDLAWSGGTGSSADILFSSDGANYAPLISSVGISDSLPVTGLTPGTPYTFRIVHLNSENAASDPRTATATTSLDAPSGLHATDVGDSDVSLAWTAVTGAAQYIVRRSTDGTNFTDAGTVAGTSFTDTGLSSGTQYSYRVLARSGAGVNSSFDPAITVTTDVLPPFLTVRLLGSVRGSGNPFSSSVEVEAGDIVDYIVQIQLGVELTANPNAGAAASQTIANWIPSNGGTSPTAGLMFLAFSLSQDATPGTIQSDFASTLAGTTTGGGTWGAGVGSSSGTVTDRGNGNHDLTLVRLAREPGNFDGIANDETPEPLIVAAGSFDIASGGADSSVTIDLTGFASGALIAGYRWRNAANTSNLNYLQSVAHQTAATAANNPIIQFNALALTAAS
jgi:hypothetical protein